MGVKRSVEYYRSAEGKIKKRYLNARRNQRFSRFHSDEGVVDRCESGIDKTTLFHIQLTTSLIEGRVVVLREVIRMIDSILRQLSIDKRKKWSYPDFEHPNNPP